MILRSPRRVKERFWGPSSRYGRDFVHVIIDNPTKRIIFNTLEITGIMPIRKIEHSNA